MEEKNTELDGSANKNIDESNNSVDQPPQKSKFKKIIESITLQRSPRKKSSMSKDEAISEAIHYLMERDRKKMKSVFLLKVLMLTIITSTLIFGFSGGGDQDYDHVALVRLEGVISSESSFNYVDVNDHLYRIASKNGIKGIILNINSGGGSPVHSDRIYKAIQDIRTNYNVPVVTVFDDIGASGAYWVASASDSIYANEASIVGSIGVISRGFGFTPLMEKVGVERRVYNAGENKAGLDPFMPEDKSLIKHWNAVLQSTHEIFKERIRSGRGERLSESKDIYSGKVWGGIEAKKLGLIDKIGGIDEVLQNEFDDIYLVEYPLPVDPFSQLFSANFVDAIITKVVNNLSYESNYRQY